MNIQELPYDLGKALQELRVSKLMHQTLGSHIIENFLHVKSMEWDEFRTQVTKWEIDKFLPIL
jgi:glutamine synthetase